MLFTWILARRNVLSVGTLAIKGTRFHKFGEMEGRPSMSMERCNSTSENMQPQVASKIYIYKDGLTESQINDVNEIVDSGRNQDIS